MKKSILKRWWFWAIAVIGTIVIIANLASESTEASKASEQAQGEILLTDSMKLVIEEQAFTAYQLVEAYKRNEVTADNDFKGKTFYIKGNVQEIGKDLFDKVFVALEAGDFERVQIYMANPDDAMKLAKGDKAVFEVIGDGKIMWPLAKEGKLISYEN